MRFDAVLFDLDGVLTDTAQIHASTWKRMFDEYLAGRARRTGDPWRDRTQLRRHAARDGRG